MTIRTFGPKLCDIGCAEHPAAAQWHVGIDDNGAVFSASFEFKSDAVAWLARRQAEYDGGYLQVAPPDGDGVLMLSNNPARSFGVSPVLAVRVRNASPLRDDPVTAARVAERLYRMSQILTDAIEDAGGVDAIGFAVAAEWQEGAARVSERLDGLRRGLACDIYTAIRVFQQAPQLSVVPEAPKGAS